MRSFERHGWDRWPRYHLARSSVVRGHDRGELRTTGGYRAARWQVLVDRIIRRLLIVCPRINSSERTRDFAARIAIHESRPCSCRSFRESPSDVSSNVSFRSFCTFTRRPREFFFARRTILWPYSFCHGCLDGSVCSIFSYVFSFSFFSRIIMYIFKRDIRRNENSWERAFAVISYSSDTNFVKHSGVCRNFCWRNSIGFARIVARLLLEDRKIVFFILM